MFSVFQLLKLSNTGCRQSFSYWQSALHSTTAFESVWMKLLKQLCHSLLLLWLFLNIYTFLVLQLRTKGQTSKLLKFNFLLSRFVWFTYLLSKVRKNLLHFPTTYGKKKKNKGYKGTAIHRIEQNQSVKYCSIITTLQCIKEKWRE